MHDENVACRGYSLETETQACRTLGGQEVVALEAKVRVTGNAAAPQSTVLSPELEVVTYSRAQCLHPPLLVEGCT